ncbi:exodeoxyribonuclease III [Stappia stellulata]|uniref:exodeoxyribonuclease III n=1 Tax=Stappia stellulata TaxID=71235 RepID=UPI00040ECF25|nr:exodeoxyribonuclease III [Stappia stellulata]
MKIATWNINGVKARHDTALAWLEEAKPDIACLQEIKSVDEGFPAAAFEALGYAVETHGQKGFNGVALLSRLPLEDISRGLPGDDEDTQARYIEARVNTASGPVRVGCLYLPNGNPLGTEKFDYKLKWMERLHRHAQDCLAREEAFVLLGDYNVIPERRDAKTPDAWTGDALFQPESRRAFRALENLGLRDALRLTNQDDDVYSFWDYQAGAWQKNNGIRIDHLLLSAEAVDRLERTGVDAHVRGWEKPSDHVPVWAELAD